MTDGQVLDAVDRAKRAHRSAGIKANKRFAKEKDRVLRFFGDSDVERAARHNELKRAEAVLAGELADARVTLIDRLEKIRGVAGEWADLVPRVGR